MFCSILFAHVLGISEFMFRKDISLLLFFPFNILPGFSMRVMLASENQLGRVASSSNFGKILYRISIIYFLNVWENSPMKPSEHGVLFVGRF